MSGERPKEVPVVVDGVAAAAIRGGRAKVGEVEAGARARGERAVRVGIGAVKVERKNGRVAILEEGQRAEERVEVRALIRKAKVGSGKRVTGRRVETAGGVRAEARARTRKAPR